MKVDEFTLCPQKQPPRSTEDMLAYLGEREGRYPAGLRILGLHIPTLSRTAAGLIFSTMQFIPLVRVGQWRWDVVDVVVGPGLIAL